MPESPLQVAGAQVQPTGAAPLHTNEFFTGLFTQGNPLGPGPVPYLYSKFYGASRFDRIIGGVNTEISVKLSLKRRLGNSMLNANVTSPVKRFFQFRGTTKTSGGSTPYQANNRLLADMGATVNDITPPSTNNVLVNKTGGAGPTMCFVAVGNTLYMGNGVDEFKYMLSASNWIANNVYKVGDMFIEPTSGAALVVESMYTLNITCVQVVKNGSNSYAIVTLDTPHTWGVSTALTFQGLQGYVGLNGQTLAMVDISSFFPTNQNQVAVQLSSSAAIYGPSGDVGTVTSQPGATQGESGSTEPSWSTTTGTQTVDNNLVWRSFGKAVYPWSPQPPTTPPAMQVNPAIRMWQPNASLPSFYSILDPNNNIEVTNNSGITGPSEPTWSDAVPDSTGKLGGTVKDGEVFWENCGPMLSWIANFTYGLHQVILDTNGNLQMMINVNSGSSGAVAPTWNTNLYGTTTGDGALNWLNIGPGTVLFTAPRQYSFSYHTISGQVTTASPTITLNPSGPVLGPQGAWFAQLSGPIPAQCDIDQIWIWATVQGGTIPLLLAKIPNLDPCHAGTWNFTDEFPDDILNELVTGAIAGGHQNDPPPKGFVPLGFHLGMVIGFDNNTLFYSGGPTTVTGNGSESFPPNNRFTLPSTIVAGWATAMGFIVFRIDGISIMLGSNTPNSPLYVVNIFDTVGLASYDGFCARGNRCFFMTVTGKVVSLDTSQFLAAIQGQLNQTLEDLEVGFPIGDLLAALTPASCFLAWHEGPSSDSGLFVADGTAGWYMMRQLTQPEQANPWSPYAQITGGIGAIADIQTAPGVNSLIMGTAAGPVWKRDPNVSTDNGATYPASANIGVIVLAQPGTQVGTQFVTSEEVALGVPCLLGVLFDELTGTFLNVKNVTTDPPNLPRPKTSSPQRFWLSQSPDTVQPCRYMSLQFSWPAQNFANELLTYTIYGRLPEKARR